jgi:hypothetical protein
LHVGVVYSARRRARCQSPVDFVTVASSLLHRSHKRSIHSVRLPVSPSTPPGCYPYGEESSRNARSDADYILGIQIDFDAGIVGFLKVGRCRRRNCSYREGLFRTVARTAEGRSSAPN